jgi:hypothetical protein
VRQALGCQDVHYPKPVLQGSDEEKQAAGAVLAAVLEAARVVAVLLAPVTPALSARILCQLGLGGAPPRQPATTQRLATQQHANWAAQTVPRPAGWQLRPCVLQAACPAVQRIQHRVLRRLKVCLTMVHHLRAGQPPSWEDAAWGKLQQGQQTEKAQPVFARLEGDFVISKQEAAVAAG